jgi:arylsulfatase A-like enzyme
MVIALASLAFAGCGRHVAPAPNVILIVLDTARADHFSCYGYERPTTPNIDLFSGSAHFYGHAYGSSPWTLPSHASMFTGKDPFEHGAHTLEGKTDHGYVNVNPLDESHFTLAEMFKQEGYHTAAVIANVVYLSRRWQIDQGFDNYIVQSGWGDRVNAHVYSLLDSMGTQPFFLFVNYMDTHLPYNTAHRSGFLDQPAESDGGALAHMLEMKVLGSMGTFPPNLEQRVIDQYDTALANLDDYVGQLLDDLKQRGLYDNSMIIVTSDHGESLGEHGVVFHGKDVYEPEVWVPLLIKNPRQVTGTRIDEVVTSSDFPRLILNELPERIAARYEDKFPNRIGNHPPISENYYGRGPLKDHPLLRDRFNRVRTALIEWPNKLIESSDGDMELYHLGDDPDEASNRFSDNEAGPGMAETLRLYRQSREAATGIVEQAPLTSEEIKKLRALGYLR